MTTGSAPGSPMPHRDRLAKFLACLGSDDDVTQIDYSLLCKMSFYGCPSESGIRSKCWKLLLGYLPPDKSLWPQLLSRNRESYSAFVDDLIVKAGSLSTSHVSDHPLNPNPESEWTTYFRDNEMLLQIDKDCKRLNPEISFFQEATSFPRTQDCLQPKLSSPSTSSEEFREEHKMHQIEETLTRKKGRQAARSEPNGTSSHTVSSYDNLRRRVGKVRLKSETVTQSIDGQTNLAENTQRKRVSMDHRALKQGEEAHWEVCERILFIYAKLNPGLGYVQGMNEILGPIYLVFARDPVEAWRAHAECDAFFCFTALMSEIRDNFMKTLDNTTCGIGDSMHRLLTTLKRLDSAVYVRLDEQQLRPHYFAFRWITLMLSQELPLPDVLRMWDSLFSSNMRQELLIYVCCAMITLVRDRVLANDFSGNMKLLQNYPITNSAELLSKAVDLMNLDERPSIIAL